MLCFLFLFPVERSVFSLATILWKKSIDINQQFQRKMFRNVNCFRYDFATVIGCYPLKQEVGMQIMFLLFTDSLKKFHYDVKIYIYLTLYYQKLSYKYLFEVTYQISLPSFIKDVVSQKPLSKLFFFFIVYLQYLSFKFY